MNELENKRKTATSISYAEHEKDDAQRFAQRMGVKHRYLDFDQMSIPEFVANGSPLREAGLSKDEIRKLSRDMGLFTASKPSYACLATRIQYGEPITPEKLARVEQAEDFLAKISGCEVTEPWCALKWNRLRSP